jgi:hypothetical protein
MKMITKFGWNRAAMAAALAMAVVIGCAGSLARAADGDDEDELLDTKIVRGIMKGLGLRKDEASIDYRERSPLVLPPSNEVNRLPAPQSIDAKKTTGWPDDPDVKEQKRRKTAEKNRKPYQEGVDDRPLLPSQYEGPGRARRDTSSSRSAEELSAPSSQAELGARGIFSDISKLWKPKTEYSTFIGEPPRTTLIEPPAGYRTPSPNQPYGIGQVKGDYKVQDRAEPVK